MRTVPEDVAAPAADAKLFTVSRPLTFARTFLLFLLIYSLVRPLIDLALGADLDPWWQVPLQALPLSAVMAAVFTFMSRSMASTWVRTSSGGLELSAAGSDPILLAWRDVATAEIRRRRLTTVLEVTPVAMDRVQQVGEGNGRPRMRGDAFVADVALLRPGHEALRRKLAAR